MGFQNNTILTDGASASVKAYPNPQPPASSTAHKVKAGGDPVVQFKQLGGEAALARASDSVGGEQNAGEPAVTGSVRIDSDGTLVGQDGGKHYFDPARGKEYTMLSDGEMAVKTFHHNDGALKEVRVAGEGFEVVLEESKVRRSVLEKPDSSDIVLGGNISPILRADKAGSSVVYTDENGEKKMGRGWLEDLEEDPSLPIHFEDCEDGGRRAVIETREYRILVTDPSDRYKRDLQVEIVAKGAASDGGENPTGILGSTFDQGAEAREDQTVWEEAVSQNTNDDTQNRWDKIVCWFAESRFARKPGEVEGGGRIRPKVRRGGRMFK